MALARTRQQVEMEIYSAWRHRTRAAQTIQERLDQIAAMRIMYAHYGDKLDQLLDEYNTLTTQRDVEEAA